MFLGSMAFSLVLKGLRVPEVVLDIQVQKDKPGSPVLEHILVHVA
jgi:hypothetical protein